MTREIKFRQPVFIDGKFSHFHYWGFIDRGFTGPESGISSIQNAKETSQQFTGLKDKNGVEIYEGDVVQWLGYGEDSDFMEETPQGRDVVTMNRFPNYWLENEEHDFGGEGRVLVEKCEVIGNIYDNPELLNK